MWLTDDAGKIVGVWGDPATGTWIDTLTSPTGDTAVSILAYPNPSRPPLDIAYHVRWSGPVTMWVVRALGPGESSSDLVMVGGADVLSSNGSPVAVLVDGEMEAGRYVIERRGSGAGEGFYRIWLAAGDEITWTDVYIGDQVAALPF